MKYLSSFVIVIMFILVMNACNQSEPESVQDPVAQLNNRQQDTTDEGYIHINQPGPRTFDESGETWDVEEDKQVIRKAAEQMPMVRIISIDIDDRTAKVTADVEQAMSEVDKLAWRNNIKSAIEGVIPRYEIYVSVQ